MRRVEGGKMKKCREKRADEEEDKKITVTVEAVV